MKIKFIAVGLFCLTSLVVFSGCIAKEMVSSDKQKILGEWYDSDSKGYFEFQDDGSFKNGYGLRVKNAGGYFEVKDGQLLLTYTYSILDGQRHDVLSENQKVVTINYRFNISGDLSLSEDGYNVVLSRATAENKTDEKVEKSESQFEGLYRCTDEKLFYYFDGNGIVNRSTGSNDKTYTGSYAVNDRSIQMMFDGSSESYQFEFTSNNELSLKDVNGKTSHFTLIESK